MKGYKMLEFKDSQKAFEDAIKNNRLSEDSNKDNFAGDYMYMGTQDDKDLFKHIDTRSYLQ